MIPKTLLVSFPRSGTHLTIDILQAFFGSHALKWVDSHQDIVKPCHNLIKTHDFDLDVTKETYGCEHVIVLWRDKEEAVDSFARSGLALPWCGGGESARGEIEAFWDRWTRRWVNGVHSCVCYSRNQFARGLFLSIATVDRAMTWEDAARLDRITKAIDRRTQ